MNKAMLGRSVTEWDINTGRTIKRSYNENRYVASDEAFKIEVEKRWRRYEYAIDANNKPLLRGDALSLKNIVPAVSHWREVNDVYLTKNFATHLITLAWNNGDIGWIQV